MKKLIFTFFIFFFVATINAQQISFNNTEQILNFIPEYKNAQTEFLWNQSPAFVSAPFWERRTRDA
ncbi:MAG: hypothetical protein IAF38_09075 [Bacteroidia bacterium]|nr:hypothetical protein [Bacteroidia bacterium]